MNSRFIIASCLIVSALAALPSFSANDLSEFPIVEVTNHEVRFRSTVSDAENQAVQAIYSLCGGASWSYSSNWNARVTVDCENRRPVDLRCTNGMLFHL